MQQATEANHLSVAEEQAFQLSQAAIKLDQARANRRKNPAAFVEALDHNLSVLTAIQTLRLWSSASTNAATLGSNVALLSTRLEFTKEYVNTLETGASKLTLADINEEGANLLALQTRQQLGISALSFAGQAEQAILQLFR
ncbi:MAG: hypothetical protein EXQ86_11075 [Rhodospirillales bacterium]|nr:hypothetical protein [Rhodospirillales bacterium]